MINTSSLTSDNSTSDIANKSIDIPLIIGLFGVIGSALLSVLAIVIIRMSRASMNIFEFYTHILLNSISISMRISFIIMTIYENFLPSIFLSCVDAVLNQLIASLEIICNFCFFYYSLLQVSTLSRNKFFLVLFKLTHNMRTLVVSHLLIALSNLLQIFLVIDYYIDKCRDLKVASTGRTIIYFEILLPRVLVIVCYIAAAVYVCVARLETRRSKQQHALTDSAQMRRLHQNMILIIKFLALSFFLIFSDLMIVLPVFIDPIVLKNSHLLHVLIYLSTFCYFIMPMLLIFVHRVLMETFYALLKRIVAGIFFSNKTS